MADVTAPIYWKKGRKKSGKAAVLNHSPAALATLGLSVFLLIALGILISVNLATLRSRFAWAQHTENILLQTASVQQDLLRMETKLRAYALTANRQHISDWGNFADSARAGLGRLDALVSDNPDQAQRLSVLRPRIEERVTRWSHIVDSGLKNNSSTVTQDVRNELAQDIIDRPMRNISAGLAGFRAVESRLLQERQAQAEKQTVLISYLSFMIVLIAPVFGAIGLVLLLRERHQVRSRELSLQLEHSQRLNLMGETA